MPIQMTREEYEARYGVSPILGAGSKIDTTPAPQQMTRAEYMIRYGKDPITGKELDNTGIVGKILTPAKESLSGLQTLYSGGEQGIANKLVENIKAGAKDIERGFNKVDVRKNPLQMVGATGDILKGEVKSGFRTAADIATTIYAPISAAIGATGIGKATDYAGQWLVDNFGQKLTDNPTFQKFAVEHPNAGEDFNRALMLGLAAFDTGKIEPTTVIERTKIQATDFKNEIKTKVPKIRSAVDKTVNEVAKIENNYAKTRKAELYSKDTTASRERIVKSGVLENAVDENGLIRTKQKGGAVEQYRKLTLDGAEDVVRKGLVEEGKVVNLKDVSQKLVDDVMNSSLEGADLQSALTGITREIQGLMKRADESGNISLEKIHDAKINTTKNIDYNTPPETKTYRKTIARAYKEIVENTSNLPVKDVNAELGKYLRDIKRLENLDGLRVKGGKLGKYTAQIAGNIAGGAIGGLTGGLGGIALGTIVGGEVAALLKGKALAGTFGEVKIPEIPKSPILEEARAGFPTSAREASYKAESQSQLQSKPQSLSDITTNIKELQAPPKADIVVRIPKNMPKTEEVSKLEKRILDNVEAQKDAIKSGHYELVAKLKEVYQLLVQQLRSLVERYKATPNKEGGFVKLPKSIDDLTKNELVKAVDYLRLKQPFSKTMEDTISKLQEKFGVGDISTTKLANVFQDLIEKTKTKDLKKYKVLEQRVPINKIPPETK